MVQVYKTQHAWPLIGKNLMHIISKLLIICTSKFKGEDEFGNKYFEKSKRKNQPRSKRFVLFRGEVEASKVPADWHGWLHHTLDDIPPEGGYTKHAWQEAHLPNLTGTKFAYRPKGHILKGGQRAKASGDYEPWTPTS